MATKIVKNKEDHHRLTLIGEYGREVILVKGGPRRAYLWVGGKDNTIAESIDGEKALRALAEAILAELDEAK